MADLRVLRRKIETQIRQLEEQLRALELVERAARELDGKGRGRRSRGVRSGTVIEACQNVALESPMKEWTTQTMLEAVRARGVTDANRENVSTSMRRLAKSGTGVLKIISGNRRTGLVYQAKIG